MRPTNPTTAPRSDSVRQRRSQRSQTRVYKAATTARTGRAYHPATVLSRDTSLGGVSIVRNTRSNGRRRVSVGVGNGAEVILRNIPVIRPGWRLLSAFLILLIGAALYVAWNTPDLRIDKITLSGNQRVSAADVQAILNLNGKQIFTVDPNEIVKKVAESFPDVTNVTAEVNSPAEVLVSFNERMPVLTWNYNKTSYWVDPSGYIFMPNGKVKTPVNILANEPPPVVETATPDQVAPDAQAKNASLTKATKAPPQPTSLVGKHISPVVMSSAIKLSAMLKKNTVLAYSDQDGLGYYDPQGWNVYIGLDLNNMDTKMLMYQAVVNQIKNDGVTPTMISVENPDTPYYRTEK
ncbi:MAG: FtsQ-type POTRA domain-containing protein [Anaerolineaceae bacterium]